MLFLFLGYEVSPYFRGLVVLLVVLVARSTCEQALGHCCGFRTGTAGSSRVLIGGANRRGRVGKVVGRGRRVGRRLRRRGLGRKCCGSVPKVDEGRRAPATDLPLLGALSLALGDHPVPGRIVDNLDLVSAVKLRLNLHRRVVALVPRAEVHEDAPELVALLVGLGNHVHALHEPELQGVHDGADALHANVLEHPRDADAVDDGLGVARGTVATGALLGAGAGVAARSRHFSSVESCFENGLRVDSSVKLNNLLLAKAFQFFAICTDFCTYDLFFCGFFANCASFVSCASFARTCFDE